MTRAIRLLAVLGLLGGIGWGGKRISGLSRSPAAPAQIRADLLDTAFVRQGQFMVTVAALGRLQAHKTTAVYSGNIEGKVTFVAGDGTPVKKGDVLFRFDETDFQRDLREKELAYENAQAESLKTERDRGLEMRNTRGEMDKIKEELRILKETNATQIKLAEAQLSFDQANLTQATNERDQRKRQADERLIPRNQLDIAEDKFRSAQFKVEQSQKALAAEKEKAAATEQQKQTDLDNALFVAETASRKAGNEGGAARMKTENLKAQLDAVKQQLEACTIRAPSDGLLVLTKTFQRSEGRRATRIGDQPWPQSQLAEIPDLSQMQVACKVPERDIGSIQPGQDVLITLEENPDKPYHGKVARVGSIAEEISPEDTSGLEPGTRVFNVSLELLEKDPKHLVPGMSANVEFITRRLPHATYVSKDCVFDEGDSHVVYVRKGDRFVATPVTPGSENVQFVEIKKGLRRGQQVAKQRPIAPAESGL